MTEIIIFLVIGAVVGTAGVLVYAGALAALGFAVFCIVCLVGGAMTRSITGNGG